MSWNHGADTRAFTRTRPDLESSVRESRSLGHADESKAAAARGVVGDEALALILHEQLDPIRGHRDVHAAMGDASVQFVAESIDYLVWNALGTRAGAKTAALP